MKRLIVYLVLGLSVTTEFCERLMAQASPPLPPSPVPPGNEQPWEATDSQINQWWRQLPNLVADQREADALQMALNLLKAIHLQESRMPFTKNGSAPFVMDYDQQKWVAFRTLVAFDALDEYERKIKTYYREDSTSLAYNKLMADYFLFRNRAEATPFLEQAHRLDPNDSRIVDLLGENYRSEGKSPALIDLPEFNEGDVAAYAKVNQLGQLTKYYADDIKKHHENGGVFVDKRYFRLSLERTLTELDRKDDLVLFYQTLIDANPDKCTGFRMHLAALLAEMGNYDGVGEQIEYLFFPPALDNRLAASPINYRWSQGGQSEYDIPRTLLSGFIQLARQTGQIDRLKSRAKSNLKEQQNLDAEEALALILVFSHDPEALDFVPTYLQDIVSESKITKGGMLYFPIYGMFGELLKWPEGKALLKPTLEAGLETERNTQQGRFFETDRRVSRLALSMGDKAMAQDVIRDSMIIWKIIPQSPGQPTVTSPPEVRPYTIEDLEALGKLLVSADMPDELEKIIPLIANTSPTAKPMSNDFLEDNALKIQRGENGQQVKFPDSRSEIIASLGESAFDAGYTSVAKLCAQTADKQLHSDWQDPRQSSEVPYSVTINANAIHLLCDLLLRLGQLDQFDELQGLLSQPSALGTTLDTATLLADASHLRRMLGDHPHGLTPALWLDAATDGSLTRKVAWDVTAMPGGVNQNGGGLFSVQGKALPQLDGQFAIQLAAGATEDDLRILTTIPAAKPQGEAEITLQPDDRFIRAICQTSETPPRLFVGPVVPISLGANVLSSPFQIRLFLENEYWCAPQDDIPLPLTSDLYGIIQPVAGGPMPHDVCQTASILEDTDSLELVGPQQEVTPGTTYCQSGWLQGSGQWGVRYLDVKGNRISESFVPFQGSDNAWHFVQQTIRASDIPSNASSQIPPTAVALEPILSLGRDNALKWQNLYLGVVGQKADSPDDGHSIVMQGLLGATAIVEAPQGGILAAAFDNGDVRCFDLTTHLEFGSPSKLPGPPIDIAFVDRGKSLVAADAAGNVLVRAMDGAKPDKIVYHAPWSIDFISASSDGSIVAVGNSSQAKVAVFDLAAGREITQIDIGQTPLTTLLVSPDGQKLFCRYSNRTGAIWNCLTGQPIKLKTPWIHEIALAHFFHIPHVIKISEGQRPCWVQVQSNFSVTQGDSSINYSMMYSQNVFKQIPSWSITAFCLSSQNNDVYTVNAKGTLELWKFSDSIKLPSFQPPPEIEIVPIPSTVSSAEQSPQLIIQGPDHLRGFPNTTLSETLNLTVLDGNKTPIANAQLDIHSDLADVTFGTTDDQDNSEFHSLMKIQTDAEGKARILVHLGRKPGQGKIFLIATAIGLTQKHEVPLESIDETSPLNAPQDVAIHTNDNDGTITVSWSDAADNRTCFIIQRRINKGPWRSIAVVPENATTYVDRFYTPDVIYNYTVTSTNESKYGYPAKLPPSPDRLGNFLP